MYRFPITEFIVVFLIIALTGCSGGGGNKSPIATAIDEITEDTPEVLDDSTSYFPEGLAEGGTLPMLFGLFEVNIDPVNLTGEINTLRMADVLGDSFMVDVTPFLTINPCADCLDIKSIALTPENYIEVVFRTKHPFEPGARLDLHVFDLRGIIVTGDNARQFDDLRIDMDGDGTYESPARGNVNLLIDPDGFTSFYDAVVEDLIGKVFDGNISPFKNLWYNPATTAPDSNYDPSSAPDHGFIDLDAPTGHNVFPMGGKFENPLSETPFVFDLGEVTESNFLFIMEASYGHTTTRWSRREPRYFLPEFHRKDAMYVKAEIVQNDLIANAVESSAILRVEIVDWQAGMVPSGSWDYYTSNLWETRNASDVHGMILDIPGVLISAIGGGISDLTGAGTLLEPYVWTTSFTNEDGASDGTYWGLVGVRDDLQGALQAPLGVSADVMNPVKMHDISTYQAFEVIIETLNIPPVADIDVFPNPVYSYANLRCSVGVNCTDPDGTIEKYEYDFDYSNVPATFTPDVTQNLGDADFGDDVITQLDDSKPAFLVAQRVTDNIGGTNIDFISVDVLVNEPPVADIDVAPNPVRVSIDVTLSVGALCNDPDGTIEMYEYDFTYDLTTFNPDVVQTPGAGFGDDVITQYTTAGSYNVAQRVTDDLGGIDIDYVDLTVNPNQNPVADLTAAPDPVRACADLTISVGPSCNDPDGTIEKYEYDFDYDLATFNPDETQNSGDPDFGDDVITQYDETELGNHFVAQRVTDELDATNIAYENVQVNANQAPTADLQDDDADNIVDDGESVDFQPGASTNDPDGEITKYEYDWDYSGTFAADVTQNPGAGFGAPVSHIFTNTTTADINVTVATRVTDDGCPDLTDIDSTQFTVHPPPDYGLPIMEDFETTATGSVPTDWGVTGRYGQAYYISSSGSTCNNTTWRWGVTENAAQGNDPTYSPGEDRFLNENGYTNWPTGEPNYTYMNRATIVYTPEITVPSTGATLTIRHWYDTTYVGNLLVGWHSLDGGRPIVSINNPGAITWTDFCNQDEIGPAYNLRPIRPLNILTGTGYNAVASTVSYTHPLWGMAAHAHAQYDITPSWRTNSYSLNAYIGETIRVGFLFGSDDIDLDAMTDCDPNGVSAPDIYPGPGWRIHWVEIEEN